MIDAVNPPDEEAPLEAEPESRSERPARSGNWLATPVDVWG